MGPNAPGGMNLLIIGLACIVTVAAITFYRWYFRRREDVIQTKAYVIENINKSSTSVSYPVIEFTTEDGVKHQYTSRIGTAPPRVKAGTYTTVFYRRGIPSEYIIDGGFTIYLFGIVVSLVGFILFTFGWLIFIGKGYLVDKLLNAIFG